MSEALDIRIGVNRESPEIGIQVDRHWKTVGLEVYRGGAYYPAYEGPYDISPSMYFDRTLATYGKSMTDDVTVRKVPVLEVSNPHGGKTITIGE